MKPDEGNAAGALTLPLLDELVDMVKPGKPELLLMSRRTRRGLKQLRTDVLVR